MADSKELQTQLDLQVQITKVLQDRQAVLKAQEKALSGQVQLAIDLCKALKCEELDDIEDKLMSTRETMQRAAEDAAKMGTSIDRAAKDGSKSVESTNMSLEDMWKRFKKISPAAAGAAAGMVAGFGSAMQMVTNLGSMIKGVLGGAFNFLSSVITLPFKLLSGLFGLAQKGGGAPVLLQALEELRGQFGSLATNEGKTAASALGQFRKQASDLAGTGLSLRRVFGFGREGLAAALKYNAELMKALGPAVGNFNDVLRKSAVELSIYRKGLGMSAEGQASLLKHAQAIGRDPVDAQREFASAAIQMGEQFGINARMIGSDMDAMKQDFSTFGALSTHQMAQVSVFTRKLGIDIKELQGIVGQFDDFEAAAQNAAKLSQAFGMNIDAMKMMQEQDPASRLSMLQKAFRETGRSVEQMSRQEKKLLATQAGLSEEAASLAFSQRGLSMSYDDVQKAGAKAEKKQLTQAEAMSKLADSIQKVFASGGGAGFTGFFDAFTKGFARGIVRSKEFRSVLRAIRKSLKAVYWGGARIGRLFVKLFPGVKKMLGGLKTLFDPNRFRKMMKTLYNVFKDFFTLVRTDPKAGVEGFIKSFRDVIKKFFASGGPAANDLLQGGKTFLTTLGGIFKAVFPIVIDGLASAIDAITDFLRSPPGMSGAMSDMIMNLFDSLLEMAEVAVEKLGPPLGRLISTVWEKVSPYVETAGTAILTATLIRVILSSLAGAFVGGIAGKVGKMMASGFLRLFTGVAQQTQQAAQATAQAGGASRAGARGAAGMGQFFIAMMVVLAAFAGVAYAYKRFELTPEDAQGIGTLMITLALSTVAIAGAMKLMPAQLPSTKAFVAMAAFMAGLGLVGAGLSLALSLFDPPSIGQVTAFSAIMMTMMVTSIPLVTVAFILGQMQNQMSKAIGGMAVLGVFMIALGGVGYVIASMLSGVPNPEGVAALMTAISSILYATMAMLPVALLLGIMLASSPWGLAGLAMVATGMTVISGLATSMIELLMPAIRELAGINIPNPESFKAVTGALVGIMEAINGFTMALAGLAFMLRPTDGPNPSTFEDNIRNFSGLVDAILNSGVGEIINNLISFARTANVKSGTADAVQAIGSVLSAVASLMQAFTPSSDAWTAVAETSNAWVSGRGEHQRVLNQMTTNMQQLGISMAALLPVINTTVMDLTQGLASVPPSVAKVAPLITAVGSVFSGVASLMKAFSPSDASWNAVAKAAAWTSGASMTEMADRINEQMNTLMHVANRTMAAIRGNILAIVGSIVPVVQEIAGSDISTDRLKSVTDVVVAVIGGVSSFMGMLSPLIEGASRVAQNVEGQRFGPTLRSMVRSIGDMGPSIQSLAEPISGLVEAVAGINLPSNVKRKMEGLSSVFEVVNVIAGLFAPGGPLSSRTEKGRRRLADASATRRTGSAIDHTIVAIAALAQRIQAPVQTLVTAFGNIEVGNPRTLKQKAEGIGALFSSVTAMSDGLSQLSNLRTDVIENAPGKITSLKTALDRADFFDTARDIITSVGPRIRDRSEAIADLFTGLTQISTSLNGLEEGRLATIVELNDALSGGGTLTVEHQNVQVSINVTVNMSAEQVARGIVRVADNPTAAVNNQRVATVGTGG